VTVVLDRPVDGCHCQLVPLPYVASVTEVPLQIAVSGMVVTVGSGFTVTVTDSLLEQPLVSVAATVYLVWLDG
jgi:hypothetical protein